jgi:hypothetical protein
MLIKLDDKETRWVQLLARVEQVCVTYSIAISRVRAQDKERNEAQRRGLESELHSLTADVERRAAAAAAAASAPPECVTPRGLC